MSITGNNEGNDFALTLDKTTGYITDYIYAGKKLMNEGPTPNYYRARIDDDMYETDDPNLINTKDKFNVTDIKINKGKNLIQVEVIGALTGNLSPNIISYQIYGNGEVIVTNTCLLYTSIPGS